MAIPSDRSHSTTDYPGVVLTNSLLTVKVYLPDPYRGYYRGNRFDWSGMIGTVEYRNHAFFGEWLVPHDPLHPEHGIGPAEEFDIEAVPGYNDVCPGESFLKIGVGLLSRDENGYKINHQYPLKEVPAWGVVHGTDYVEMTQHCGLGSRGYSYTKRIELDSQSAILRISHTLVNTGMETLATEYYCHNFISINNAPVGPGYRVLFPFEPLLTSHSAGNFSKLTHIEGREISFISPMGKQTLWTPLAPANGQPIPYRFAVEHVPSGAGVYITGDFIPSRFCFFAAAGAVCPEPFLLLSIEPGASARWTSAMNFRVGSDPLPW